MSLYLLLPILAFLLGSIPFGLLIAKSKGIDIRQHGSGNIGATNVFRIVGKGFGIFCLLLDYLKGFIPVILAINLCRISGDSPQIPLSFLQTFTEAHPENQRLFCQIIHVLTAFAAIMGHNYSPWIGFKGGKGIATTGGAFTPLMPFAIPLLILIFLIVTALTKYVSLGSIAGAIGLPALALYGSHHHGKIADGTWNKPLFTFCLIAGLLAIWKHRSNIQRLLNGTESKINEKKKTA